MSQKLKSTSFAIWSLLSLLAFMYSVNHTREASHFNERICTDMGLEDRG